MPRHVWAWVAVAFAVAVIAVIVVFIALSATQSSAAAPCVLVPFARAQIVARTGADALACGDDVVAVLRAGNVTVLDARARIVQTGAFDAVAPLAVRADGRCLAGLTTGGDLRATFGSKTRPLTGARTLTQEGYTFRHVQFCGNELYASAVDAAGRGRIFVFSGTRVVRHLHAPTPADHDAFGAHFAVAGDWLIAARPLARVADVFLRGRFWFTIDPHATDSVFPYRVAIASDGAWAALANPTAKARAQLEAGSVLVFRRDGHTFKGAGELTSTTGQANGMFGANLASHRDSLLAVSEATPPAGAIGNVWVFRWDGAAMQAHSVLAGDTPGPFGATVAFRDGVSLYAAQAKVWRWSATCE